MIGDGTTDSNDLVLSSGFLHASAQARAENEEFHLIILDAALFAGAGDQSVKFPTYNIPGTSAAAYSELVTQCTILARTGTRLDKRITRVEIVTGHVLELLRRNSGFAVKKVVIGAREQVRWSSDAVKYHPDNLA